MGESRTNVLVLMLTGIVILLMVATVGLFIRMNQLQSAVLPAREHQEITRGLSGLEIETPAPPFSLWNTEEEMVSLQDFSGQRVLLVFSSTKCPYCVELYPKLKSFSEQRKEMRVVMISMGTEEENRALVSQQGFTFPVLMWENEVAKDYLIPGTPFLYVVNEKGMITDRGFASLLEEME